MNITEEMIVDLYKILDLANDESRQRFFKLSNVSSLESKDEIIKVRTDITTGELYGELERNS